MSYYMICDRCELEEYVTGWSRGYGRIQTAHMNVTVHTPTTPAIIATTKATLVTTTTVTNKKVENTTATPDIITTGTPAPQVDNITNGGTSLTLPVIIISCFLLLIVIGVLGVTYYRYILIFM